MYSSLYLLSSNQNDGGSIPTRRDLVKDAKKGLSTAQIFENKQLSHKDLWLRCALSGNPLEDPVVSDYKGRLYKKEAVLEWLLDKPASLQPVAGHITSFKDIVTLQRSMDETGRWICEITANDVINESSKKFVYLVECGHVFSEAALKEVQGGVLKNGGSRKCILCDTEYDRDNAIVINPQSDEDIARLEKRYQSLKEKGLTHSLRPMKKKRARKEVELAEPESAKKVRVKT